MPNSFSPIAPDPPDTPPMLQSGEAPPPGYYQANLMETCRFVARTFPAALRAADRAVIADLEESSEDAQRLFARLLMRKGRLFRAAQLSYPEVACSTEALDELARRSLISMHPQCPADLMLSKLTKSELRERFPETLAAQPKGARKAALLGHLLSQVPELRLRSVLARQERWIEVQAQGTLRRLQLLYFGRAGQDLSAFVLRDLGVTRLEAVQIDPSQAALSGTEDLDELLRLRRLAGLFAEIERSELDERFGEVVRCAALASSDRWREHRTVQRARHKLLNRLGRWYERQRQPNEALSCYAASERHPARERAVRVLHRAERKAEAQVLLEHIRREPWCGEERVFGERFGQRGAGFKPRVEETALPDPSMRMTPGAIESVALQLLEAQGAQGIHSENAFSLGLAGLAYWDVVFAPVRGAFSNPFQLGPNDLYWEDFAAARETLIATRSEEIAHEPERMLDTLNRKVGISNRLVSWMLWSEDFLQLVLRHIPARDIAALAEHTIRHLHSTRTGFPDLFVIRADGTYEFVEVKGPNDTLQPQQRVWLQRLHELGISARVLKFKTCTQSQ